MNISELGIHLCSTSDNLVHPILAGVTDWDSESLSSWLDMDDLRPVHSGFNITRCMCLLGLALICLWIPDMTSKVTQDNPNLRIHKASLEDFLRERTKRNHILNFLSIDLSGQQVSIPVGYVVKHASRSGP